jgi:tetratricopeptide (TPR) repeat protein
LDQAEEHYRDALAADPDSAEALYSIGCVASHRADFESSLDSARRALVRDPDHVGATALAGNALLALERHAEALPYLETAAAAAPSDGTSVQIALCLEALGELEQAEGRLREVLEADSAYATRHTNVAFYSHSPFWADVHAHLARVLQRRGNVEEARLHYHLAKRIDPLVELDPIYLEIMSRDELEDHPIDRVVSEAWADELDLSGLGDAAEAGRSVLRLTGSSDIAELEDAARREDAKALVPVAADLTVAAQMSGQFGLASTLRVVSDCLYGNEVSELFHAVHSPTWKRLIEIAELLHAGRWSDLDALAAAAREGPPTAPEVLVGLVRRFVAADAASGLAVARVVDAALDHEVGGRAAVEATLLAGSAWADSGDAAAEAVLAKAAERAGAGGYEDLLLTSLDRLGQAQGHRGRTRRAVETFTRLVREADRLGDLEARRRGRYNLAVALGRSGRLREAYDVAVKAASAAQGAPDDEFMSQVADLVRWTAWEAGVEPPRDVVRELAGGPEGSIAGLRRRAARLRDDGRTEEALGVADKACEAAGARGARSSEFARTLHERSAILAALGRIDEARVDLEAAIDAAPRSDAERLVAVYHDLAAIQHKAGSPNEAVEALEHALGHARRLRSAEDEAAIRELLATLLRDEDPELAIYHFGKVVQLTSPPASYDDVRAQFGRLAEAAADDPEGGLGRMSAKLASLDSPADRRDAALITGMAALETDRPELAEQPLTEALTLAASGEWRDAECELSARQALGTSYRRTARYAEAIDQYRSALDLAERLRDEVEAAEVRGRLAIALRYTDELDVAVEEYRQALATFRRYDLGYRTAINQMNLASTLFLLGRAEEALDAALEALTIFDDEGEHELARRTLAMLAGSAAVEDLPADLVDRLRIEAAHSGDGVLLAWSAIEEARRLLDAFDVPGAEQQFERAIEIHRSRGDRFNEAISHLNRARLLGLLDPSVARASAEAARRIAVAIGQRHLAAEAEAELLQLAVVDGDDDEIDRLLESLVMTWIKRRRALRHDRDRIALANQAVPLAKLCADYYLAEGRLDRAFDALDLARAQALTDALVGLGGAPGRAKQLLPRVRALLDSLPRPAVALTLDLVGRTIVLGTFRSDDPTPGFVDTGVTDADLERLLGDFRIEMLAYRGHGPQTWPNEARRLLASVAGEVSSADLVILVLDGKLQQLPLHALGLPAGTSVVHAPSFVALELSRQLPQSDHEPFSRFVSVGVSFPDEARAVGLEWGGLVLSGRALDKDHVREAVSGATIVHFACHGFFDTEDLLDSGLLLSTTETPSRSDVLALRDLVEWRLRADLVVLSACETGLGKVVPSDFLGLGRGILAAGARAVIVTLWPVEDAATQTLMIELYRNMARQRDEAGTIDVALALSAAQQRFAETRPPYDWAAFKLIGWPEVEWSGGAT